MLSRGLWGEGGGVYIKRGGAGGGGGVDLALGATVTDCRCRCRRRTVTASGRWPLSTTGESILLWPIYISTGLG